MNGLTLLVLLSAAILALCSPIKRIEDGSIFFCEKPGCADSVKAVFCNDVELLKDAEIPACSGPPPPQGICQHEGRAFVSTDTNKECEFEGDAVHLDTKKCTGNAICTFNEEQTQGDSKKVVVGVVAGVILLALIIALIVYFTCCKKRQMPSNTNEQVTVNPQDSTELVSLNGPFGDDTSPSQLNGA